MIVSEAEVVATDILALVVNECVLVTVVEAVIKVVALNEGEGDVVIVREAVTSFVIVIELEGVPDREFVEVAEYELLSVLLTEIVRDRDAVSSGVAVVEGVCDRFGEVDAVTSGVVVTVGVREKVPEVDEVSDGDTVIEGLQVAVREFEVVIKRTALMVKVGVTVRECDIVIEEVALCD